MQQFSCQKPKVAFVCVHNSCRSQIAEALGRHLAGDVFESYSAGTETKPCINQDAVRLMKQVYGIDMEQQQRSKLLEEIPQHHRQGEDEQGAHRGLVDEIFLFCFDHRSRSPICPGRARVISNLLL